MIDAAIEAAERDRYLGSSDAAAVVNRNPPGWKTSYDVWARKTGRMTGTEDADDVATRLGSYLEPAVLAWTEDYLGAPVLRAEHVIHPNGYLAAHLDGRTMEADPPGLVEAKVSGLLARPGFWEAWGEGGSDDVPLHILLQVHHQFAVCDAGLGVRLDLAYVPVLLGGRGFTMYRVPRSDALVARLVELEEEFWSKYVLTDTAPPDVPASLDTLRLMKRESGPPIPIAPALVETWQTAKANAEGWARDEQKAREKLLTALGDHDAGSCALGTVSYKPVRRAAYQVRGGE